MMKPATRFRQLLAAKGAEMAPGVDLLFVETPGPERIAGISLGRSDFRQYFDVVGMQNVRDLEECHGVPEGMRVNY